MEYYESSTYLTDNQYKEDLEVIPTYSTSVHTLPRPIAYALSVAVVTIKMAAR